MYLLIEEATATTDHGYKTQSQRSRQQKDLKPIVYDEGYEFKPSHKPKYCLILQLTHHIAYCSKQNADKEMEEAL